MGEEHAVFGVPEVKRGLIAGGGAVRLLDQLPHERAMRMLLTNGSDRRPPRSSGGW
jgi:enoyl-CoA hydratase